MKYLVNSFTINMFPSDDDESYETELVFRKLHNPGEYLSSHKYISAIGHTDLAAVIEKYLKDTGYYNTPDLFNRITVSPDFDKGDALVVAQYRGPRLPEGATEMPSDAKIEWWVVYKRESSPVCPKGMVNCGI